MAKRITLFLAAIMTVMALAVGASAHNAGPCNDSGGPGNSDYARHHIVPLAKAGSLGSGGHIPGSHQGFSVCLGVHP